MMILEGMPDWMGELWNLERRQALAWASLILYLHVTQIVNRLCRVHAMLAQELAGGLNPDTHHTKDRSDFSLKAEEVNRLIS